MTLWPHRPRRRACNCRSRTRSYRRRAPPTSGALQSAGESKEDIVGYVFAINGRIVSADVYPSNGLFAKMWSKQLGAGVTEAIGEAGGTHGQAPGQEAAAAFLKAAAATSAHDEVVNGIARRAVHDADKALYVEAQRDDGSWVHRSYLAK